MAKELLLGPDGQPMIDFALNLARERNWPIHVLTRTEKSNLIDYLNHKKALGFRIEIQIVPPTPDWPHTLLRSQPFWRDENLVVLPDTVFAPVGMIDQMALALKQSHQVCWAAHHVTDQSTWGVIEAVDLEHIRLCEKPSTPSPGWSWGLFGFRKEAGETLLEAQSRSTIDHQWQIVNLCGKGLNLTKFRDLTR